MRNFQFQEIVAKSEGEKGKKGSGSFSAQFAESDLFAEDRAENEPDPFFFFREPTEFAAVQVNPELGTVCWPCGADLDPDVLYALVTGAKIPSLEKTAASR